MAIDRTDIEKVYPGSTSLSDAVIEIYIDMTEGIVPACMPEDKKDIAQSLLVAHYCSKVSTGSGSGEVIEIDNGSMKKKFAQTKDTLVLSSDPYSTTQYGQTYLDMVTIYCGGVFFAGAGTDCYY